jgi:hypothetical protein
VEMREKAWSTLVVTVHQRLKNSQVGIYFVHNRLRKRPYALCKSCRGSRDLQLRYRSLWALQFKFFGVIVGQSRLVCRASTLPRAASRRPPLPVVRHWLATACTSPPYLAHAGETREPPYSPTFKYIIVHPPCA